MTMTWWLSQFSVSDRVVLKLEGWPRFVRLDRFHNKLNLLQVDAWERGAVDTALNSQTM